MKHFLASLASVLLSLTVHAVDTLEFRDAAEERRFQQLTRELRCLVCQNQNLADSDAGLARDLRQEVFEQLRRGKSDVEIKQYLVERYSDFVLYDPPLRAGTLSLWFGPAAVLLIGIAVVFIVVRRRAANITAAPPTVPEEDW